jgi:hypothetical protein
MEATDFYNEISRRVSLAKAGVTVLTATNPSAAVEAAMLAASGKPQLIVAEKADDIPRLVRGLPNVSRAVGVSETADIGGTIRDFLEANLSAGGAAMTA